MMALPGLIDSPDCWVVLSLFGRTRRQGSGDVRLKPEAKLVWRESVDEGVSIGWVMTAASSEETWLPLLLSQGFGSLHSCLSIECPRGEWNLSGWVDAGVRSFINRFFNQLIYYQAVPVIWKKGVVPLLVALLAGLVGNDKPTGRLVVLLQATVEEVMVLPFHPAVVPSI